MSTREDSERRYAQIEGERDYYKRMVERREAAHAAKTKAEEAELSSTQELDEVKAELDALAARLGRLKGEGCFCQGCGCRYHDDLIVPDDVWEAIKPEGKAEGAGLLCPTCIHQRVVEPLMAHVERLGALGMMVRDAAVDMDMEPDEFWDRIEKWETGWIDTPHHQPRPPDRGEAGGGAGRIAWHERAMDRAEDA